MPHPRLPLFEKLSRPPLFYRLWGYLLFSLLLPLRQALASCPYVDPRTATGSDWCIETVFGIVIQGGTGSKPLNDLIGQILGILYAFAGGSAMILILWGGYKYTTASGDPKSVQEAKDIIKSALTGLMLVLTAYIFAQFMGSVLGDPDMLTNPEY
mgnify:CR=1 FL=1